MSDPNFYREYECNLSAPYVRGKKAVKTQRVECTSLYLGNLKLLTGEFPLSTTHTLTPTQLPCLGEKECNGELSLYLNNEAYVNVTMAVIVRAEYTTLQALVYQRVGNFVTVDAKIVDNNVVIATNPASTCTWVFRGK